jgi:hypothetical protein
MGNAIQTPTPAALAAQLAGQTIPGALSVAGLLATTGVNNIQAGGQLNAALGAVDVLSAGSGLKVAEGANAKQGVATLVAGTVTVPNTSVTATSRIFLCCQTPGGTPGWLQVSARVAGTSFTILSSSGTDTSVVAYQIFEAG